MAKLGTGYIDLLLIHFPIATSVSSLLSAYVYDHHCVHVLSVLPQDEKLDEDPPSYYPAYKYGGIKTLFIDPLDTWRVSQPEPV